MRVIAAGDRAGKGGAPRAAPFASRGAVVLGFMLALAACEDLEPYKPQPASEIPDGPGILSGDDGEYVIYRE